MRVAIRNRRREDVANEVRNARSTPDTASEREAVRTSDGAPRTTAKQANVDSRATQLRWSAGRLQREQPDVASSEERPADQDEPADNHEEMLERAMTIAEEQLHETNPKKLSVCVRCGTSHVNRDNRPFFDANDVPWIQCRDDCEPVDEVSASCFPLDEDLRSDSVLNPTALDPDDALYMKPEEPDDGETDQPDTNPWPDFRTDAIEANLRFRARPPFSKDHPGQRR